MIESLNRKLLGWANYFRLGSVGTAYRILDMHATSRPRRWLCKKHKGTRTARSRYPDAYLYEKLGLIRVSMLTRSLPWGEGVISCPGAGCLSRACPVR